MWFNVCLLIFALPGLMAIPEVDEKYLNDIVVREGQKENLVVENVKLLKLYSANQQGFLDGYNLTRADIEIYQKTGQPIKKTLLIRAPPQGQTDESRLYQTDIDMYKEVFPKIDKYLAEQGQDTQNKMWLKAYDVDKYNRIFTDDVNGLHYYIQKSWEGLDMEHSKIAVEHLAKYHAISAVLKNKNIINVTPFGLSIGEKNKDATNKWYNKVFTNFVQSIRAAWGAEWENTAKYFELKAKTVTNELFDIWHRDESRFNVLVYGPFNIINNYFKYDTTDKKHPIAMKAVDYRYTYWNSPVFDLQMFINTSPRPEIITDDARREEIIHHYAEVLQKYLKEYKYEKPISKEYILQEIRRTELPGLVFAINILEGMYHKSEDNQYSGKYIIDSLASKEVKFESKGMFNPTFIEIMKKLVIRAQKLGIIQY